MVRRISYSAETPSITSHPTSKSVAPGASVTFSVRASGPAPLSYQWQRNGVNISGATAQDYSLVAAAGDNGARFRAIVSNSFGNVLSNEATLTVTSNRAPTGTITQPAVGTLYNGGSVISYAGTATDPENGTLPASAFTWRVDFHHDTHSHPFVPSTSGVRSGSFTAAKTGHTETNVWYRIFLTVRDSAGATHTTFRDVQPRKVNLTIATNPAGLQLRLDAQPVSTPRTFGSVVGVVRGLGAPATQLAGGRTYEFVSWSDGGAASHNISTPATNRTYTANLPRRNRLQLGDVNDSIRVNFQPSTAPVPSGYLVDSGLVYAARATAGPMDGGPTTPRRQEIATRRTRQTSATTR